MSERAQRLLVAARKPLPEGTFAVGAGLLVAGITAYGFQILSFRALGEEQYTALNGLWVIVFVVAPGFFLPLEQEVGRALADRRARGLGGAPLIRRAAIAGGVLTTGLILVSLAASAPITESLFHDQGWLLLCFVIALATFTVQHLTRGTLSGNGRFGPYGLILAVEGIVRLIPCALLWAAGVENILAYGLSLAIPPVIASAVSLWGQHGLLLPGPPAPWRELSTNIGYLFLGSVLAQALGYAAFLGAIVLANTSAERTAVASFLVGFFLARIPILLFQAVQAALLPKLAGLVGSGRHADFRSGLRMLVLVVAGIGVVGVIGGYTVGPWVGGVLFGDKFTLGHRDLALLAAGSGLFILALTLAQALIALMGHARAAFGWIVGIVGFVVVTALGDDLFLRVELGFLAGAAISAAITGGFLVERMRAGAEGRVEELRVLIESEPLEL